MEAVADLPLLFCDLLESDRLNRDTNYGGGFHLKHEFTPNQKSGLAEPLSYAGLFGITANAFTRPGAC